MTKQRRKYRAQSLFQLVLFAGIVIFLNILANARIGGRPLYTHLDLTEEKRFTLTQATRRQLATLDDVVYIQVLLEGDFPAGFRRLQKATREMLEDFRSASAFVEFDFENPSEGTPEEINKRREEFSKEGIEPVNLQVKASTGASVQLIYPYAVISYKNRSLPVKLLENEIPGLSQEVVLNNSVGLLEYKLANAIQKLQLSAADKPAILFTSGHGELNELETADLEATLRPFYNTGRLVLDSIVTISGEVRILVVAKPQFPFSEKDKFKIDQYLMNGGKILWLLDNVAMSLDSLQGRREYYPSKYPLNLDDQLFRYGIRMADNLVLDIQCSTIPLATGTLGNAPQFDYFPYPYHVVVSPSSAHPVVKGLGLLNLLYPSALETSVDPPKQVQRTVLLESSPYSMYQLLPIGMDFNFLRYGLDKSKFNKPPQPLALLLEGTFPSFFANRVEESMLENLRQLNAEFRRESLPTRMIVASDGDLARNEVNYKTQRLSPLGYNRFAMNGRGYLFANKDFLINAIEYLIDPEGVIEARGKEVKLRLLDTVKAEQEQTFWRLVNIVLPLLLLGVFGLIYQFLRRRKYG